MRGRRAAAPLALALLATGAGAGIGPANAQQPAVVPSGQQEILERADRDRSRGSESAPIRIVEVSDFECPYCARFHSETGRLLDSAYVQTGRVRHLWVSFPNSSHPRAWPAVEAAFCAGAAGRFWEMHDLLFERRTEWIGADDPTAVFVALAGDAGVDRDSFAACVRNDETAPLQVADYDSALRSGITSTPFFVVGDSLAIRGAVPTEQFRAAVDSVLAARGAPPR
ncbi:MAG: thioredoxin domain-containing protein [Gemmatimonadota bacterium]|nr:thioredoxin domain-containing protein [Gemmatimonadota bacterium]